MTEQKSFSLRYSLTIEEVEAGLKRRAARARHNVRVPVRIKAMHWFSLILLAFAIFQFGEAFSESSGAVAQGLKLSALFLVAGAVALIAYIRRSSALLYRRVAAESMHSQGEQHVLADGRSIELQAQDSRLGFNFSWIEAIEADEAMQLTLISFRGGFYFLIPWRAFASQAQRQEFVTHLAERARAEASAKLHQQLGRAAGGVDGPAGDRQIEGAG